jgi:hypothetical protein
LEEVDVAPKRDLFEVRELCSRFYGVGRFAQAIISNEAETSKAAAEPLHSKKSPAARPAFNYLSLASCSY